MTHLWEVDHDYYCHESNFFDNGCSTKHDSWQSFLDEEGDSDMDMNLVFRWDWMKGDEETSDYLILFIMNQRKGIFRVVTIYEMNEDDEPSVIEYLTPRMKKLFSLWEPLNIKESHDR